MNRYYSKLVIRIAVLILLSAGTGLLAAYGYWWELLILLFCIGFVSYSLIKLSDQPIDDIKRLIGGIRYSDFSVSFRHVAAKGGDKELAAAMDQAVASFNERNQKQESELIFYETLLNRIDFAIFAINPEGEIIWINKHAQDIAGKPSPRQIKDMHRLSPDIPDLLAAMTPKDIKTIRLKTGQTERNLIITMVVIQLKGQSTRVFSFKNIQEVIDDTESEAWKKLIRILTHEMMNSITPILSLAETFSEPAVDSHDPEMMQKAMSTIHRRSNGLVRFVNNYQRLTRIPLPQPILFPVNEMMEDITHLLKSQGIVFSLLINPLGMKIQADREQLEQVLINLIKNASEACEDKTDPEIKVVIYRDEYQHPVITVSDNGDGILPEVQDKVFIPFFSTKKNGSGIGLSVCRQIIKNHKGHISLVSEPKSGSAFTIRL